jgi:2'-5' RNA ligase
MGFDLNGGPPEIPAEKRLNVYALVIYIPDPLGRFLDDLRRELVPDCNPHAHVSVLPPRSLAVEWPIAGEQVRSCVSAWAPFEITLGGIQRFPVTNVIYIEVASGAAELHRMHERMNTGHLLSEEPFEYHPHITLAQEIPFSDLEDVNRRAQCRWSEFTGPRTFLAERAAFVRNTIGNQWIDLAEFPMGDGSGPRVRSTPDSGILTRKS